SGNEAADVRGIRDATGLRTTTEHAQTANQLKHEPKSDRNERGHLGYEPRQKHSDAICWEQQNVTAQHAGDRARRPEAGHQQARSPAREHSGCENVRKPCQNPADEVIEEISQMAKTIFDVVAEDKKEKHVAEDVSDAAVHEHRSDEREINRNRRRLQPGHLHALAREIFNCDRSRDDVSAGKDLAGYRRVGVGEFVVVTQSLKEHKDQDVNCDQYVVNDWSSRAS